MKSKLLVLGILLTLGFTHAQDDAASLIDRIIDNMRGESQVATLEMNVVRPWRKKTPTPCGFIARVRPKDSRVSLRHPATPDKRF